MLVGVNHSSKSVVLPPSSWMPAMEKTRQMKARIASTLICSASGSLVGLFMKALLLLVGLFLLLIGLFYLHRWLQVCSSCSTSASAERAHRALLLLVGLFCGTCCCPIRRKGSVVGLFLRKLRIFCCSCSAAHLARLMERALCKSL